MQIDVVTNRHASRVRPARIYPVPGASVGDGEVVADHHIDDRQGDVVVMQRAKIFPASGRVFVRDAPRLPSAFWAE